MHRLTIISCLRATLWCGVSLYALVPAVAGAAISDQDASKPYPDWAVAPYSPQQAAAQPASQPQANASGNVFDQLFDQNANNKTPPAPQNAEAHPAAAANATSGVIHSPGIVIHKETLHMTSQQPGTSTATP